MDLKLKCLSYYLQLILLCVFEYYDYYYGYFKLNLSYIIMWLFCAINLFVYIIINVKYNLNKCTGKMNNYILNVIWKII